MDRYQQLKTALDRHNSVELRDYLNSYRTDDIKSDILRLLKERASAAEEGNDLKAFTMAAMQGLCTGKDTKELSVSDVENIAWGAAEIAQRTLHLLTELSKQQ